MTVNTESRKRHRNRELNTQARIAYAEWQRQCRAYPMISKTVGDDPFAITAKKDRSYGRSQHPTTGIASPGRGFVTLNQMAHGYMPSEAREWLSENGTDLGYSPKDERPLPTSRMTQGWMKDLVNENNNEVLEQLGLCQLGRCRSYNEIYDDDQGNLDIEEIERLEAEADQIIMDLVQAQLEDKMPTHPIQVDKATLKKVKAKSSSKPAKVKRSELERNTDLGIAYDPTANPADKTVLTMVDALDEQSKARFAQELKSLNDGVQTTAMDILVNSGTRAPKLPSTGKLDLRAHDQLRDKIDLAIGRSIMPNTFMVSIKMLCQKIWSGELEENLVRSELQARTRLLITGGESKPAAYERLNAFEQAIRSASKEERIELATCGEPLIDFRVETLVAVTVSCRNVDQVMTMAESGQLAKAMTKVYRMLIQDNSPTASNEVAEELAMVLDEMSNQPSNSVKSLIQPALSREGQLTSKAGEKNGRVAWRRKNLFDKLFNQCQGCERQASAQRNGKTEVKADTKPRPRQTTQRPTYAPPRPRR